tara:strand:- start:284 stop:469 length:186 start_codon:yes stop_codon:yes gene_type:complete
MSRFCLITIIIATMISLIITSALYQIQVIGAYGEVADYFLGVFTGLIGFFVGGCVAIKIHN